MKMKNILVLIGVFLAGHFFGSKVMEMCKGGLGSIMGGSEPTSGTSSTTPSYKPIDEDLDTVE